MGITGVRRTEPPHRSGRCLHRFAGVIGGTRHDRGAVARDTFLQQQLGRLHTCVAMEPVNHPIREQHIREGHKGHPLVVCHVGRHHHTGVGCVGAGCGRVGFPRRVVDRVHEPERALETGGGQPAEVCEACGWRHTDGQRRGIRGDHQLITEAALEAQPRDSKRLVLVVAMPVHQVVGTFGNAPGDPTF